MLGYVFRVIRMILVIFTVSYFIGTLWYIYCWQIYTIDYDSKGTDSFIGYYNFDKKHADGDDFAR